MASGMFILSAIIAVAIIAIVVSGVYFLVKSLIRYHYTLKNGDNASK
ncbi:MAG: hypothetical protein K2L38_01025 [Dysosmobacter sp.]|nr:hypothetical protein [Dysosmobacter sp.]